MTKRKQLKAMRAVYTYFFPEVRRIVHSTDNLEDDFFLTITSINEAQKIVDSLKLKKRIIIPATLDGKVDLDEIHQPIIDFIVQKYKNIVIGIPDFKFRYFTSGSSEGIFHALAELKTKGIEKIYTLKGEYEGYKEYGKTLGLNIEEIDLEKTKLRDLEKGTWFISNPSARDGNIISNEIVKEICNYGNKVYLDLAYVGSTRYFKFFAEHENVSTLFLSFSKPYGVFRFRIGFTLSREPINSLYANKWFKDILRLLTAAKLVDKIGPNRLYNKYRGKQLKIIDKINKEKGLKIQPSDVILLGHIPKSNVAKILSDQLKILAPFKRNDSYRLCLTPYFEELEKEEKNV